MTKNKYCEIICGEFVLHFGDCSIYYQKLSPMASQNVINAKEEHEKTM